MPRPSTITQGKKFGGFSVIARGPDFVGEAGDKRVQWWIDCNKCSSMFLKVARDIDRHKTIKCKHCDYVYVREQRKKRRKKGANNE